MQAVMGGPGVDTPSAQEFRREIAERVSDDALADIAAALARKSAVLRELLAPGAARLDRDALRQVLRLVFSTRRHADEILDAAGPQRLGAAIGALLDPAVLPRGGNPPQPPAVLPRGGNPPQPPAEPVASRFDAFDAVLAGVGSPGFDLPGELLHFSHPGRYWLWTRWLWNPATGTGALSLVTDEGSGLATGSTRGETYLGVGRATAFLAETGKAAGFISAGDGLFGTDVYLAAVYGVYMYTVLRMRMTREFNRLLPPLPDLIRRLLGVHHLEV